MSTIIFFSTLHEFVNAGKHKEKAVMQMPKGMEMKVLNIDDYKVTSHIMDMPAYHKLMKSMDMKHSEMEGDTSHHIMVEIAGKVGNKIEDAVVKIKVLDPRNRTTS